ncbi:hypothetical protein [Nissabacter sp. SGAir0207]|uniref:hypothetical protein n=1 Tax=Nissabacter sp. SGAir0207 TaxID=2126321 RepID=UPI0010F526C8|nr:hypothetical protein [Nissabacter sp. SGAir0207]
MKSIPLFMSAMGAGIIMAFAGLGVHSYWIDELFTLGSISGDLHNLYQTYLFNDIHPFLYNTLLYLWVQVFGVNEAGTRAFSLFCSLLTALYVWQRGRQLLNPGMLALYLLLFLTSYGFIHFALQARSYALLIMLSTMQSFEFIYNLRGEKNKGRFYLLCILVCWTHFIGLFFTAALFAARLLRVEGRVRQLVEYTLVMLVSSSHFIIIMLMSGFEGKNDWVPLIAPLDQIYNTIHLVFPITHFPKYVVGDTVNSLLITLAFIGICAFPLLQRGTESPLAERKTYIYGLLVPLGLFIVITAIISLRKPVQLDRTMYICSPLVLFIAVVFLERLKGAGKILAVVIVIPSLLSAYKNIYYQNDDYMSGNEAYDQSTLYAIATCNDGNTVGSLNGSPTHPEWRYLDFYLHKYNGMMINPRCQALWQRFDPRTSRPDLVQFNHPTAARLALAKPLLDAGYRQVDQPGPHRDYNIGALASPAYVQRTGVKTRELSVIR